MQQAQKPLPKRTRSCCVDSLLAPPRPVLRRAFTSAQQPPTAPATRDMAKPASSRTVTRASSRGKENVPPPRERDEDAAPGNKRRRLSVEIPRAGSFTRERACSVASVRSELSSTSRITSDDSSSVDSSSPAPDTPRQLASFSSSITIATDDHVPTSPVSPYKRLKALLRLSHRDAIIGRENERAALEAYLVDGRSDALYVTGPPGTGKTALVTAVTDVAACWTSVVINCMGLAPGTVWDRIARGLNLEAATSDQAIIETLLDAAERSKYLIILDELDSFMPPPPSAPTPAISHLLSKLFSLPTRSANIKLVAISNTLDLTLRARLVLASAPAVLSFKPYKAPEMAAIIRARLASHSLAADVENNALELLSRKVDAQDGDLRTALACLASAASLAEADAQRTRLNVKIALKHVITALAGYKPKTAPGSAPASSAARSLVARTVRSLPLQARFVLLAAVVAIRKRQVQLANAAVNLTPATLYSAYSLLLSQPTSPYPPSPETDFRDLLSTLESTGILSLPATTGRRKMAEIELCAADKEILDALVNGQGEAESVVRRVWEREESRIKRALDKAAEAAETKVEAFHEME